MFDENREAGGVFLVFEFWTEFSESLWRPKGVSKETINPERK
jgi:hypothetical protein